MAGSNDNFVPRGRRGFAAEGFFVVGIFSDLGIWLCLISNASPACSASSEIWDVGKFAFLMSSKYHAFSFNSGGLALEALCTVCQFANLTMVGARHPYLLLWFDYLCAGTARI